MLYPSVPLVFDCAPPSPRAPGQLRLHLSPSFLSASRRPSPRYPFRFPSLLLDPHLLLPYGAAAPFKTLGLGPLGGYSIFLSLQSGEPFPFDALLLFPSFPLNAVPFLLSLEFDPRGLLLGGPLALAFR